jgi:aspartyl-tRNA(Asn)/glutamyl-tRNA(Gln) amidotransferase subunit C
MMAVTLEDVRRIAVLARLGVSDERAHALVAELNAILGHMDVLSRVDTDGIEPVAGVGAAGTPLRSDTGPPMALERPIEHIAPRMQDGFFLVPRLSTHESAEES